uniref:Oxidoreductase FAD/NAD(P)-binding domain-containing protein n=1 Tax=Alexandrium andersonii TaxID=327968 RepID=A0A7S2BEY5_9DINO|mmetsp:Transcript_25299/g.57462  ORF Transcript_25299/g.57462 Transcript_25299/m.57462 type:complete len:201 (+) Transcript_25299:2-604(+)
MVSRWLDTVPVGDSVPMVWPWPAPLPESRRNPGRRVGLVAYGIGITELYRVAASELRDPAVQEVALLYVTRTADEQEVLRPELEELAAAHPGRFRLEGLLTHERVDGFRSGRLHTALLSEVFPWADGERENVRFLPAGTHQMMEVAMHKLESLGYERETYLLIRERRRLVVVKGPTPRAMTGMAAALKWEARHRGDAALT